MNASESTPLPTGDFPEGLAVRVAGQWLDATAAAAMGVVTKALFAGAFNPLHAGHRAMAQLSSKHLGVRVHFEISAANVDKRSLTSEQIRHRIAQFAASDIVWVSRHASFVEKARCFPNVTFIVGADTIERIADLRYYHDDRSRRDRAIDELAERGSRFLVFGRLVEGRFCTLTDVPLPTTLLALCDEVPAAEFRMDISSTQLRTDGDDVESAVPEM